MPYPSNRPFFANFFAAFRAQSYVQKAGPASVSSSAAAAGSSAASSSAGASGQPTQARPITTKAQSQTTSSTAAAVAAHAFQTSRSPSARPHSTSPRPAATHAPASPRSPAHSSGFQRSRTPSRGRRGSDTSSDSGGFKDLRGAQNWYIGGRAPNGEERFYQLGMVRRYGSADRLSLDRLSL